MVKLIKRFRGDKSGATLVEGLISLPIMVLLFATLVEFGWAVVQLGQATKAVQYGARRLAVSTPLIPDLTPFTDFSGLGLLEGDPVPSTIVRISCGAGAGAACISSELDRLVLGGDGVCDPTVQGTYIGMCDIMPQIRASNIRVTYIRDGLGYVGRPAGPILTIRLELVDLQFRFFLLGRLLSLTSLTIPPQAVTITSEDLSN